MKPYISTSVTLLEASREEKEVQMQSEEWQQAKVQITKTAEAKTFAFPQTVVWFICPGSEIYILEIYGAIPIHRRWVQFVVLKAKKEMENK